MSLSASRCVLQTILLSGKPVYSASMNAITFMTLQCHKVQLKCSSTNFTIVSRKIPIVFNVKRHVNVTSVLKMSKNYYDILGVSRNASQKQIKDAYFKLAMKYHPDKNQGVLTQKFRDIKEAYDVLSNDSNRMKYNNSSNNYTNTKNTSQNWSTNSSNDHFKSYEEYKWTNSRTEYQRAQRNHAYDYSYLRPFNVFINVIKVPKNVVKTQIDIILLTFIKNHTLKMILYQLFQIIWNQILKSINFNVLISSTSPNSSVDEFVRSVLGNKTIRIELTEMDAIKGKSVRVHVNENEKVLIVNIPRGVKKNQSFYLFYLIDDNDDRHSNTFK